MPVRGRPRTVAFTENYRDLTMRPFLRQVADHYYSGAPVDRYCFIFPNRRSVAFFSSYLRDDVADSAVPRYGSGTGPMCMPLTVTVSDFFRKAAGLETADRVTLLLELYDCYSRISPDAESLDDFISWGDVILADFSDVDKNRVDPAGLFRNVSEFKDMQDDFSHLEPGQRKAVERFLSHFRENGTLRPEVSGERVKGKFLMIWNLLMPLYTEFNRRLEEKGLAYDGMVFRKTLQALGRESAADLFGRVFPGRERFVFVGLNALNECEKSVLKAMRDAGIAEFCWDYSSDMLRNLRGRPFQNMRANAGDLPQTWELDPEGLPETRFNVLAVPSNVGQTMMLSHILRELGVGSAPAAGDCVIVLPDETLLMPVLNTIPAHISDVNLTMGYPMTASSLWSLMSEICRLQLNVRRTPSGPAFYHRQVSAIFSNGLFAGIACEKSRSVMARVREEAKHYVPQSDLSGSPLMDMVFRSVLSDPSAASAAQIDTFSQYQLSVLSFLASRIADSEQLAIETEFARRYYTCVNLLRNRKADMLPRTYVSLLSRIASGESVPFEGKALRGLQVMGPLETRNLDFDNVVILSCNEGRFPKKSSSGSFIPPELRRGFGLPTNEFKDAILAYNFYRLVQRARNVWLLYDSRTDRMGGGEESRYIKQLEYHFRKPLKRYVADCGMSVRAADVSVAKPSGISGILKQRRLSASSVETYLRCQMKFYYSYVLGLRAENEVAESLDGGMVGNVFHSVMQALYMGDAAMDPDFSMERDDVRKAVESGKIKPLAKVSDSYLAGWLLREDDIKARIRSLVKKELGMSEVRGRDLVTEEVILMYVMNTVRRDREYLRRNGAGHFNIIGLELPLEWDCGGYRFFGYVDRMDSLDSGRVRVVDYKTGKVSEEEISVREGREEETVNRIFNPDGVKKRPLIALQLFLYDKYAGNMPECRGVPLRNAVYHVSSLFNKSVSELESHQNDVFMKKCGERLAETLEQIADPSVPFRANPDEEICDYCDYRNICKASI